MQQFRPEFSPDHGPHPNGGRLPPEIPDHELVRCIGRGSYGEVWLAWNILGTYRAVKVVYRSTFEDERPYEREFEGIRKYEPVSRAHEGLMHILQVGRNDTAGYFYYVMELADNARQVPGNVSAPARLQEKPPGQTSPDPLGFSPTLYLPLSLGTMVRQRGRLPVKECVRLGIAMARALAHLHECGLVHRDIKPSNIIFVNGRPKLADIGLVTEAGDSNSFVGTEGFIPPEGPGTAQADLFSLGKLLYEISTGKDRQRFPEPLTLQTAMPDRAEWAELNELILKACETDPSRRYTSADEMLADLEVLQSGKSLKRVRKLERRVARLTKLGLAAAMVGILAAGALFYEQQRAREMKLMADNSRHQLVRARVANGARMLDAGDYMGSLLWFVEALKLDQGDPQREAMHRARIEVVLRQCPKLVALGYHDKPIHYAEFSRDGRRMVAASADGTARVWDTATGEPVTPPLSHQQSLDYAIFSPDGTRVATASRDGTAGLWDAATGRPLCPPLPHGGNVEYLSFSPDGRQLVTASESGIAQVWNVADGQRAIPPLRHAGKVNWAVFSPDGRRVLTASQDGTAQVWEAATGKPALSALEHRQEVLFADFSPDGRRIVTTSMDWTARVWDAATGKPVTPPLRHSGRARQASFSHDNRRLITTGGEYTYFSVSGEAMIWDTQTSELMFVTLRHDAPVNEAVFSPDERWVLTGSSDGTARRWNFKTGEPLFPLFKQAGSIRNVALHPDGRQVLTSGRDGVWRLWDLANDAALRPVLRHSSAIMRLEISPDGTRIVTADDTDGLKIWEMPTGRLLTQISTIDGPNGFPCFSPDGRRIACSMRDGGAGIWDAATGRLTAPILKHNGGVNNQAFSPDGQWLLTVSSDRTARLWDARTGAPRTEPLQHSWPVWCGAFSPDGKLIATGSSDRDEIGRGEVCLWRADTGRQVGTPLSIGGHISQVTFSPDSRRVITACYGSSQDPAGAQIWEVDSGLPAGPPLLHSQGIESVAFSPDGSRVATGSRDGTARVWDARAGLAQTGLLRHRRGIRKVAFSPDGQRVATAAEDGTSRVWDVHTGEPITPELKLHGWTYWLAFSPDGRYLVTAGGAVQSNGEAHIYELPERRVGVQELETLARVMAGAELDATGGLTPLANETLLNQWRSVRKRVPEFFTTTPEQVLAWHQIQAADNEQQKQWFAARFHLSRWLALQPGNREVAARLEQASAHLRETPRSKQP